MQERATKIKMLYPLEKPIFPKVKGLIVPIEDIEGLRVVLAHMKQEREAWENKSHSSNAEKLELQRKLLEKDDILFQKYNFLMHNGR